MRSLLIIAIAPCQGTPAELRPPFRPALRCLLLAPSRMCVSHVILFARTWTTGALTWKVAVVGVGSKSGFRWWEIDLGCGCWVICSLGFFLVTRGYSCTPAAARMYVQVLVDLQLRQKISVTRVMHQEAGCQSDLLCDTVRFYCRTRQCCLGPFDNTM
jgi:hypothetical protein